MEFDRQVARLFGALLERSEADANVVANVVKVFEDDGQDPRKLLVVLLLATEGAVNLSKLSADARQRAHLQGPSAPGTAAWCRCSPAPGPL